MKNKLEICRNCNVWKRMHLILLQESSTKSFVRLFETKIKK